MYTTVCDAVLQFQGQVSLLYGIVKFFMCCQQDIGTGTHVLKKDYGLCSAVWFK